MSAIARDPERALRPGHFLTTDQDGLRAAFSRAGGFVLVGFWRPWCFMANLVWPVMRSVGEARSELTLLDVKLGELERPDRAFRVRWLPATVLFYDGRAHARWYGGELDPRIILQTLDRLRAGSPG